MRKHEKMWINSERWITARLQSFGHFPTRLRRVEELPGTDGGLSSNAGDSYLPGWTGQPAGHKTDTRSWFGFWNESSDLFVWIKELHQELPGSYLWILVLISERISDYRKWCAVIIWLYIVLSNALLQYNGGICRVHNEQRKFQRQMINPDHPPGQCWAKLW